MPDLLLLEKDLFQRGAAEAEKAWRRAPPKNYAERVVGSQNCELALVDARI